MDGWADGWMGGWESGWMDGRMYGCERRMDSGGGSRRHAGRVFVVLVEGVVVIVKSKGGMGVSRCREKIEEEKKKKKRLTLRQSHALRCFAQRGHYLLTSECGCCCPWRCWRERWSGMTGRDDDDDGGGVGGRR